MKDNSPNKLAISTIVELDETEARLLINQQIERGLIFTPAEVATAFGLEAEYPEIIAKAFAVREPYTEVYCCLE